MNLVLSSSGLFGTSFSVFLWLNVSSLFLLSLSHSWVTTIVVSSSPSMKLEQSLAITSSSTKCERPPWLECYHLPRVEDEQGDHHSQHIVVHHCWSATTFPELKTDKAATTSTPSSTIVGGPKLQPAVVSYQRGDGGRIGWAYSNQECYSFHPSILFNSHLVCSLFCHALRIVVV